MKGLEYWAATSQRTLLTPSTVTYISSLQLKVNGSLLHIGVDSTLGNAGPQHVVALAALNQRQQRLLVRFRDHPKTPVLCRAIVYC